MTFALTFRLILKDFFLCFRDQIFAAFWVSLSWTEMMPKILKHQSSSSYEILLMTLMKKVLHLDKHRVEGFKGPRYQSRGKRGMMSTSYPVPKKTSNSMVIFVYTLFKKILNFKEFDDFFDQFDFYAINHSFLNFHEFF